MITHNLIQSTPEWHAHRANFFNASDAPAMIGCSPYKTRSQLLHELHTGLTPEVDAATQRRFDEGHRIEALARPLAEKIVGEDLYPQVGSNGKLSASFDGLTADDSTDFEHKTLNAELLEWFGNYDKADTENPENNAGNYLPRMYCVQMEHQCMVSGSSRVLFMASKWDGDTLIEMHHCWYTPDADLRAAIVAGWNQFEIDLAAYVPTVVKEMPKGEVTLDLPALYVHAKGEITTSNMAEYGVALEAKMKAIRSIVLVNDQDFANAKTAAAQLRDSIEKAKLAKAAMLAQTVTVGEAALMIDAWCESMRLTALQLETDVKREDVAKKTAMVTKAKGLYDAHIVGLEAEIAPTRLGLPAPVFADSIKNKRNFASMQDAVDTALANGKMIADATARDYREKRTWLKDNAFGFYNLFVDLPTIISKPVDDFKLLVTSRIDAQKKATADREAQIAAAAAAKALTDKALADAAIETARLKAEALAAEQRDSERRAEINGNVLRHLALSNGAPEAAMQDLILRGTGVTKMVAVLDDADGAPVMLVAHAPTANVVRLPTPQESAARILAARLPEVQKTPPTLKLGQINERLAPIHLAADGLRTLGFEPAARDKNAVLFHESDFALICARLVVHIELVQSRQFANANSRNSQ